MKPSHLIPFALILTGLTGCVTPPKSAAPPAPAAPLGPGGVVQTSATTAAKPDPTSKFEAMLTHQGLAQTPAKAGEAARLTVAWNNKIIYAPDPTRGGEPIPGLLTRVYLFGPDQTVPLKGDGELLVAVWDDTTKAAGGEPRFLELWHIDPESAKKFQRPDFMGEGYTVFLPFSHYHIDLKRINVLTRYNGADGRNLVASPETLTLDHSETLQRAAERLGAARGELKSDLKLDTPLLNQRPPGALPIQATLEKGSTLQVK